MGAFITMAKGRTAAHAYRNTLHPAMDGKRGVKVLGDVVGDNPVQIAMAALETHPFNEAANSWVGAVRMGVGCWLLFGRDDDHGW